MSSENQQLEITFLPEPHEYFVNGKKAKLSVTNLIEKQISHNEYFSVDPGILKRAADRGTDVHADLEYIVGKGTEPRTLEGKNFVRYIKEHNWTIENARTEYKLAIEHATTKSDGSLAAFILCGTADLICTLNGKPVVVDHKTTSVIHTEDVRWQMSLLDYMARKLSGYRINGEYFEYHPAEEMYVFHFDKQGNFTPVQVDPIPDVEIERLLDAEAKDEEYHATPVDILTPKQEAELLDIEKQITSLKAAQKVLEAKEKELKRLMIEAFEAHPGTTSVQLPSFTVSYIPPTTRTSPNFEIIAKDFPQVSTDPKYQQVSNVSGSIRITLNKNIKDTIEAYSAATPIATPNNNTVYRAKKRGFFD